MGNPGFLALVNNLDAPGIEWASRTGSAAFPLRHPRPQPRRDRNLQLGPAHTRRRPKAAYTSGATPTKAKARSHPVNVLPDGTLAREAHLGHRHPALQRRDERRPRPLAGRLPRLLQRRRAPLPTRHDQDAVAGNDPARHTSRTARRRTRARRLPPSERRRLARVLHRRTALTADSGAAAGNPDLYVCEIIESDANQLECQLTDLTPARELGRG